LYLLISRVIKQIVVIIEAYHICQVHTKFYPTSCFHGSPYGEEIVGDHQHVFQPNRSATDHIFCIQQILDKKWSYSEAVLQQENP